MIREKPHRLDLRLYRGNVRCAFTFCTAARQMAFLDHRVVEDCEKALRKAGETWKVLIHVYLFMPDHLHVLLEGEDEASDVWKAAVLFKQLSGFAFKQSQGRPLWQKDFFDHVLRKEEETEKHVRYILDNPIRKGIVQDWSRYPYKGSTVYDLSALDFRVG